MSSLTGHFLDIDNGSSYLQFYPLFKHLLSVGKTCAVGQSVCWELDIQRLWLCPTSVVKFSNQFHVSTWVNHHPIAKHDHVFYTQHFCPIFNLFSDFLFPKLIVLCLLEAVGHWKNLADIAFFFSKKSYMIIVMKSLCNFRISKTL